MHLLLLLLACDGEAEAPPPAPEPAEKPAPAPTAVPPKGFPLPMMEGMRVVEAKGEKTAAGRSFLLKARTDRSAAEVSAWYEARFQDAFVVDTVRADYGSTAQLTGHKTGQSYGLVATEGPEDTEVVISIAPLPQGPTP